MTTTEEKKNIVIVGGGYAGISVFNSLHNSIDASRYNVVLISARDFFIHYTAAIRLVVTPEEEFGSRFNEGNKKLVIGKVTNITEWNDKTKWQGPVNFPEAKKDNSAVINSWRSKFEKANDVVIIGGGACLRVKSRNLTIHSQPLLLNASYPEKFRDDAGRRVTAIGLTLVLSDHFDTTHVSTNGSVKTRKGKEIIADLVILTRGPVPDTDFIATSLGDDTLTESKLVKILPTFQLVKHPHIFAAGDVIDWAEQKQAAKCQGRATIIAKNVTVLSRAQIPSAVYNGQIEAILISIGKSRGTAFIAILWGILPGNWFTSLIKSRNLLIGMIRGQLKLEKFDESA
ncbi:hypothetical protein BJ165DRAFT_1524758 [Panaeolus papilionaceus]|nr:hypothetical protein BJ165DRAFT_1524758 [Panaeolus papilionaceus]